MIIRSLRLKNIRSYIDQIIEFPVGSVLLSGDIGCGKSTILLAVEFALFGLVRGTGNALLRSGSSQGEVELLFDLDGKEVCILRALRRFKDRVEQEAGVLIINGVRKDLTVVELKSLVFEMLGYPKDLVAKSKNWLYRCTVYTPQEEMKAILFESNEERVNLLRKVFDIDKYKRIKDNCEVYAKSLRERRRFLEGALVYFVQKKSELEQKSVDLDCVRNELLDRSKSLKEIKQKVCEQRLLVSGKESEVRKFNEVKVSHSALRSSIMTKQQNVDSLKQELDLIQKNILKLEGEIKVVSFVSDDELNKCRSMVECKEKVLVDKRVSFAEFSVRMKQSNEVKSQINVLSICPVCKQKVSDEYKSSIFHVEDDKVLALQIEMKDLEAGMKLLSSEVSVARAELQRLQSLSESARVFSFQNAQLDALRSTLLQKRNYFESIASEIGKASLLLSDMEKELSSSKLIEDFGIAKSILDSLISSEKDAEVAYQRLIEKENMLKQLVDSLSLEVEGMKQKRILVQQLSDAHQWVSDFFAPLVTCIEQHVMARVHRDFTCLFQDWFAVLVNDEVMSARLDEFFTPVILQNGYELSVENLSGGEKTACALAYRLALNKVINNLISAIKTKDLLILDEPTDGFSDSQLDTMRDVLLQLGVKQLIIVSHERKIEGFVDHVMRIVKNEHVSSVEQANI